jgi:hypothetical protein
VQLTPTTARLTYQLEMTAEERDVLQRALTLCTTAAPDKLFEVLPDDAYEALAELRDSL